jgi:hypothetical protein
MPKAQPTNSSKIEKKSKRTRNEKNVRCTKGKDVGGIEDAHDRKVSLWNADFHFWNWMLCFGGSVRYGFVSVTEDSLLRSDRVRFSNFTTACQYIHNLNS